jgi:hypothetical protein
MPKTLILSVQKKAAQRKAGAEREKENNKRKCKKSKMGGPSFKS